MSDARHPASPRHPTHRVLLGLGLVAAGTLALLDRQQLFDLPLLHTFWPLALVLLGLARLAGPRHAGGGVLILIGGLMTAHNLGYSGFEMHAWWPAFIILGGLAILRRGLFPKTGNQA